MDGPNVVPPRRYQIITEPEAIRSVLAKDLHYLAQFTPDMGELEYYWFASAPEHLDPKDGQKRNILVIRSHKGNEFVFSGSREPGTHSTIRTPSDITPGVFADLIESNFAAKDLYTDIAAEVQESPLEG
ncbi:hypothetical protein HY346_02610 [Candidatus Microgenomates bacterium]|nr:hypothetical protein [Candidatus Microgenomates bacterium]